MMAMVNNQLTKFLKFRSWNRPLGTRNRYRAVLLVSKAFTSGVPDGLAGCSWYSCQLLQASFLHPHPLCPRPFILPFFPQIANQRLSR